MTVRAARLVRGWAAACAATAVAAASHVLGGGEVPEPAIVLFSLALSGMFSCLLAGRSLSLPRLAAAVVFSQGLFHLLFSLGSDPATIGAGAGHAGHAAFLGAVAGRSLAAEPEQAAAAAGVLMWFSHALAAAATVWLLACGEKAASRLAEAVGLRPGVLLPLFQPGYLPRPVAAVLAFRPLRLRNLGIPLLAFRHRGPPVAFVLP